jgi:2-methylfumaryl-CoA isomerase
MTVTADQSTAAGPLAGLRIIDLSTYVAGPSATMTMAQLGAQVIRIDPIGGATDTSRLPLDTHGNSLYWAGLNKAKRSVEIDTASPEGRRLVTDLVAAPGAGKGIVVTNAVGQPWLSYEALSAQRPDLIQVHIAGRSDGKPAVDYTVNCEVGLPLLTGPVDFDRPVNHVLPAWDLLTGLQVALAVVSADRLRSSTGKGQHVTVSLADVAVATMAHLGFVADVVVNGHRRRREGNYLYGSYGSDFATADGQRVMIVALTERHWRNLVAMTGLTETIAALERSLDVDLAQEESRYEHREVLTALLSSWFAQRSFDEVTRGLDESRVLWGTYRTVEHLVTDPKSLMHATDLMVDVDQPGVGRFPVPRPVLDFAGWDDGTPAPAPRLGEHTAEVLREVLGFDDDQLTDLRARSVIGAER